MSDTAAGVAVARDYYDSDEADGFYSAIWGGEDIHIGLYDTTSDIREASRQTVDRLAGKLGDIAGRRVVDLGSGYGGAARVLAREHGAHVTCLNLSTVENERNRRLTAEAGLSDRIDVVDGSYDDMPFADASFDIAMSQDAILHAPDRRAVLDEVARVLRPGGLFAFHDPMQADGLQDPGALQPIYDRIHLPDLGSPSFYKAQAQRLGWENLGYEDMSQQLVNHYERVRQITIEKHGDLAEQISEDYLQRMKEGLTRWVEGGKSGWLAWGVFLFQKPVDA